MRAQRTFLSDHTPARDDENSGEHLAALSGGIPWGKFTWGFDPNQPGLFIGHRSRRNQVAYITVPSDNKGAVTYKLGKSTGSLDAKGVKRLYNKVRLSMKNAGNPGPLLHALQDYAAANNIDLSHWTDAYNGMTDFDF